MWRARKRHRTSKDECDVSLRHSVNYESVTANRTRRIRRNR